MTFTPDDERWMCRALGQARLAAARGEVPIGALVVLEGRLVGAAHDGKELFGEPTAHAEILALREAARRTGGWRLDGSTMYVTLEPCPMCAGALIHARVERLVFAARNPRWGACSGTLDLLAEPRFNHHVKVEEGLLREESADLLRQTFRAWREAGRAGD